MKAPLRIAVIGGGRWGKNILKTLGNNPACIVAYTVTRDYKTLLEKNDIDAVVIATPSTTHAEIALPFIAKKIPVFIEKPMTMSLRDAKRVVDASKKYKTHVFVGHVHLYSPAFQAMKLAVKDIGKVKLMLGEGASNGPFRADASAMWDWAPHDISMMIDIAKSAPVHVSAWGESITRPKSKLHDITYMKLMFKNGMMGIIASSKISPEKRRKFTVVGSKSSVIYDDTAEKKVTLYTDIAPTITKGAVSEKQAVISFPEYGSEMSLTAEIHSFLGMVASKKKPLTDAENGLAVVAILEAAEKSIVTNGKEVSIKI